MRLLVGGVAAALAGLAAVLLRRSAPSPSHAKPKHGPAKSSAASAGPASSSTGITLVPRFSTLTVTGPTSPADQVSVMCWNILSDSLARPKSLPWASPDALRWPHRSSLLCAELRSVAADIVALQEVDASRWGEVQGWLPGWHSLLQEAGKEGAAGRKADMLLALLWKPRFTLVWSEHRSRALLAELSFIDSVGTQQRVYIVNCHLEGSPYRPNDRVSQVRSALQRLEARHDALGLPPRAAAVVLCGDFNSGRTDTPWRLCHSGRLEAGATEAYLPAVPVTKSSINHPYALTDCHHAAGTPVPFTRKAPGVAATIDCVWHSHETLQLLAVYDPLRGTKAPKSLKTGCGSAAAIQQGGAKPCQGCPRCGAPGGKTAAGGVVTGRALAISLRLPTAGLPNMLCPSDHLPLGVVLGVRHVGEQAAVNGTVGGAVEGADGAASAEGAAGEQMQADVMGSQGSGGGTTGARTG